MTNKFAFAVVKGGVVINIIVVDGDGSDYTKCEGETLVKISEKTFVTIGSTYSDGEFTAPPEPAPTPEQLTAYRLRQANSEYERATLQITALNEQIEDEDYDGTTEVAVKAELASWTNYRKELRAYLKAADGSQPLPSAP